MRSWLWATEGQEQRAGTHGLQVSSVRTEMSSHCNFCSASHLAEGLTLKYLAVGRQDLAADACRVLANGCFLQGETFESCFSPYPIDPVLLHWPVRDQEEKQEHKGEMQTPFPIGGDLIHETPTDNPFPVAPGKASLVTLSPTSST